MKKVKRIKFKLTKKRLMGFEIIPFKDFLKPKILESITKQYRVDFYMMMFILRGEGIHEIDFVEYPYSEGDSIFIAKDRVHKLHYNGNKDGYLIMFTEDFLYDAMGEDSKLVLELFKDTYMNPVFKFIGESGSIEKNQLYNLQDIYSNLDSSFRTEIISSSFKTLVLLLKQKHLENEGIIAKKTNRIFLEFADLVEKHIKEAKSVEEYSEMMSLSKKTINLMTRKAVDMSAKQFIIGRIIIEIKRNLCFEEMSIGEISDKLGFTEPSNMTKFFKKYAGVSPKEFRQSFNSGGEMSADR